MDVHSKRQENGMIITINNLRKRGVIKMIREKINKKVGLKLTAAMLGITIVSSSICSITSGTVIKNILNNSNDTVISKTAIDISNNLEQTINMHKNILLNLTNTPDIQSMDWDKINNFFKSTEDKWGFKDIFVMNTEGIATYPYGNKIKDQSKEEFFAMIKEQVSFITEPYIDDKQCIITIVEPIYKDGKKVGSIGATVDLIKLAEKVQDDFYKNEGNISIVNKDGVYISNSDYKKVFNGESIYEITKDSDTIKTMLKKNDTKVYQVQSLDKAIKSYSMATSKIEGTNWSVLVQVSDNNKINTMNKFTIIMVGVTFASLIVALIIAILLIKVIIKNLHKINKQAKEIKELNFAYVEETDSEDEFGQTIQSINKTIETLNNTLNLVKDNSNNIVKGNDNVDDEISDTSARIESVTASVEEITASIQESSALLEEIKALSESTNEVTQKTAERLKGSKLIADKIKVESVNTYNNALKSKKIIETMVNECGEKVQNSLDKIVVVENIQLSINEILKVFEKIKILSLNASIESARAGEQGKGFSVIADEIKKLADQTKDMVTSIQNNVNNVTEAVDSLTISSSELLDKVQTDILKDYNSLIKCADEYKNAGITIESIINNYQEVSNNIGMSIIEMNKNIETVNGTVRQISDSSISIAEDMCDISSKQENIAQLSIDNKESAKSLIAEINKFKL